MSCSTCGSSTNCTTGCPECANTLTGNCSGPCATDCGCGSTDFPCPQPYYAEGFPSVQDHGGKSCCPTYFTTIKVSVAWNIPACGLTAVIIVPYLKSIIVGSNIWNPGYGYFEVTLFNPDTFEVTVKNNCLEGNAAVGTQVPKCAEFMVVSPCCETGGGGSPSIFPYLALDFVAPPVSGCIDIIVTTTNGLQVGKNVQIGSGTYRVSGIAGSGLMTICNDGSGITPGTPVIARNGAGDLQYPVVLIDSNPCNGSLVTSAVLLGCSGGVIQPVTGLAVGSVFVLIDPVTGRGQFQVTGQPTFTCTALTQSVTLSIGQPTYTLTVDDSTLFSPTDIVQLGSRTDRFTITSTPDGTHVVGNFSPVPASVQLIPAGTSVCLISCCETLQNELDAEIALRDQNQAQLSISQSTNVGANVTGTLNNGTPAAVSNPALLTITNPHLPTHDINVMIAMNVWINGIVTGSQTDPIDIAITLQSAKNGGSFTTKAQYADHFMYDDLGRLFSTNIAFTAVDAVVPGAADIFRLRAVVTVGSTGGTSSFQITQLFPTISILGVGV